MSSKKPGLGVALDLLTVKDMKTYSHPLGYESTQDKKKDTFFLESIIWVRTDVVNMYQSFLCGRHSA